MPDEPEAQGVRAPRGARPRAGRASRGCPRSPSGCCPSGLRVVAVRRPSVPVVHVRLRIPTAVRRDAGPRPRRACSSARCCSGTAERSQGELAETLQRIGGSLRVSGDADRMVLAGESLRGGLGELLGLLSEVLTGAAYPKGPVEGEAARLADQLQRALSQPGVQADEAWLRQMYGEHPYGREHPAADEVLAVPAVLAARRAPSAGRARRQPAGAGRRPDPGPRPGPGGRGSRRLGHQRQPDAGAEGRRRADRAAAAGRPPGRRPVEHPDRRAGPGPHRPVVRGCRGGQRAVRRVLLLAAGDEHPRGQGLHLQPAQLAAARAGGVLPPDRRRRRDRGDGARAGRDRLRARPDGHAAAVGGRGRRDRAVPRRVAGAVDRDPGRSGGDPVGAAGRRAGRHLAARAPGGADGGDAGGRARGRADDARAGVPGHDRRRRRRPGRRAARRPRPRSPAPDSRAPGLCPGAVVGWPS